MIAEGIDTHVEAGDKGFEIWARQEDQIERAKKELSDFLANPSDSKYDQAHNRAAEIAREQARKQKKYRENVVRRSVKTGSGQKSPLVILLIAISGLVGLLTNFGEGNKQMLNNQTFQALAFNYMKGPEVAEVVNASAGNLDALNVRLANARRGEVWRMLTPIFIHFGTLHLIFNMIWLWQLGRVIEFRYGTFWLGILILFTGIISNFAQGTIPAFVQGTPLPDFLQGSAPALLGDTLVTMFGGMSGVVYGLFGFVWMKSSYDRESRLFMPSSTILIMILWFFFCLTPWAGNVANWCHGIGLVTGMLAAFIQMPASRKKLAG